MNALRLSILVLDHNLTDFSPNVFWIYVQSPEVPAKTPTELTGVLDQWNQLTESGAEITPEDVKGLIVIFYMYYLQ